MSLELLFAPLAAFAVTGLLIPLVRGAAIAAGKVSLARQDRWHERPTPTLGGVGIFLGFALVVWIGSVLRLEHPFSLPSARGGILPLSPWESLVAASSLAFLLGLVDDFVRLRPAAKLVGQVLAASVLLVGGIGLHVTGIYLLDALASLLWFVGITNALNLLDNMDGLAGGVALISAGFLGMIFLVDGNPGLAGLAFTLVGTLLGFLLFNYPPARIFMGDSGSLFLGMLLSGLALSPGPGMSGSLFAIVAVPALILAVPILDTTLVTVSRVLEGRSPAQGGKDHSSHRLVSLGMSEERAVWVLWALSFVGGAVGILFRTAARGFALLGGGLALVALVLLGGYLLQIRFRLLRAEGISGTVLYDRILRLHARFPILLFFLDALLIGMAYFGSYLLRWDPPQLERELAYFQRSLPVVLVVKLLVFASIRVYRESLLHFGLGGALRVLKANLMASVSVAAALLMLQRTGLSRGVVVIDFLLLAAFTLWGRFSFRIMENWIRRWSRSGIGAVLVGPLEEMEAVLLDLERGRWPELRPMAVADRREPQPRGQFKGYPLFGGGDAPRRALAETGADTLLIVERHSGEEPRGLEPEESDDPILEDGTVDVYRLKISMSLGRQERRPGPEAPSSDPFG